MSVDRGAKLEIASTQNKTQTNERMNNAALSISYNNSNKTLV